MGDKPKLMSEERLKEIEKYQIALRRFADEATVFAVRDLLSHIDALTSSAGLEEAGSLLSGQLEHTRDCPDKAPLSRDPCTCGLRWRIMLQTEITMHAAWRKRGEEAEAENVALHSQLAALRGPVGEEEPDAVIVILDRALGNCTARDAIQAFIRRLHARLVTAERAHMEWKALANEERRLDAAALAQSQTEIERLTKALKVIEINTTGHINIIARGALKP